MSPHQDLQPYACLPELTRGRKFPEPEHPYRDCYERDRDRVIHSRAFRRLEYKTQVFPNHEGDHFRTRLTHTIEVAQLARTVARVLGLNSTLAEAIALAHDIGHPPFGHVGEEVLDTLMSAAGGFEHNRHTLRTVDELEERYAGFPGLNLTYEVREGIAKHRTRYNRFTSDDIAAFDPREQPPLEAQLIDLVDHIAYNVHDIDDGVEAHVLAVADLSSEVPLFGRAHRAVQSELPRASERELFNEAMRRLLNYLVTDLIETSREAISTSGIDSLAAVRAHRSGLASHSAPVDVELEQLQAYLFENLYRSPRVDAELATARAILQELFAAFLDDPELLPARHRQRCAEVGLATAVADYVAGMTDRFVMREHDRIVRRREAPPNPTEYGV